jgi:putative GTP pyrophosphokinase
MNIGKYVIVIIIIFLTFVTLDLYASLPEFKDFKDICFEIQVRTILQHAWAEIYHDRNYKFQGILPEHIKRISSILSGVLKLADKEFDRLSYEIDEYAKNVSENTKKGIFFNIKINTTSLREYMNIRFKEEINKGLFNPSFGSSGPNGMQEEIIQDLKNFGITTLDELDKVIPDDISYMLNEYEKIKENVPEFIEKYYANFTGILETFMMIKDLERYLKDCWNYRWKYIDDLTVHFISVYNNIPTSEVLKVISKYDFIELIPYF